MKKTIIAAISVIIAAIITSVIGPLILMKLTKPTIGSSATSSVNLEGNYGGTMNSTNYNTSAHMTLIILQSQSIIEGSLTIDPPLAPSGGTISGSTGVDSARYVYIMFTLQYTEQSGGFVCGSICTINFSGLLYNNGSLQGTYSNTQDGETGTWAVSK